VTNPYPDAETRRAYLDTFMGDQRHAVREGMSWILGRVDAYMSEQNLELVKALHGIQAMTPDDAVQRIQELMEARKQFMNMGDLCRLDGWLHSDGVDTSA